MAKPEQYTERAEARPHGNRAHMRRKLSPMAYVELGQENGGILLNLSEGGFAVQSALTLSSREFSELRFQVPACQGWLTARGRVAWLSDSKKEAGIQFTELPGEARREIHKWVSAEGDPKEARERIPAAFKGSPGSSEQIFDTPYRGGGGAHDPTIAQSAEGNGAQAEKEHERTEPAAVAIAEPPPRDFRFGEYSMFAAAASEKETVWTEPTRRRGNWGGAALLGILVAALFFALGATVGRGTVDKWISYLAGWTQNQLTTTPPQVTPPAPPEQAGAPGPVEDSKESKRAADEDPTKVPEANPNSGTAANSEVGTVPHEEKKDAEVGTGTPQTAGGHPANDSGGAGGSTARSAISSGTNERRLRHSAENVMPRNNSGIYTEQSSVSPEHSILVNAPEPGGRPFYVNLPGEAISASPAIAISARRTLEILPSASGRSERVVIGKLISHSEPFYPAEARNRRMEGNVELRARIGRTGQIIAVTPVSGAGLLSSAALTAVREWRYEPTFIDGDPAETVADITIVFRLP
jgi:TonB family protein